MAKFISIGNVADILGVSVATARNWGESGTYPLHKDDRGRSGFYMEELKSLDPIRQMLESNWESEETVTPQRDFTSVELFAGAGGLALGMEKAGFRHVLLNEFDPMACRTLRRNRPDWNVLEGDVHNVDFSPLHGLVDFLSGGFPCQAFSYAGKKGGLNDTRGTLFFELARAVKQIQPKVFLCENVKGLLSHDGGRTIGVIRNAIAELGYTLVEPRVLKAVMFKVPQKRERLPRCHKERPCQHSHIQMAIAIQPRDDPARRLLQGRALRRRRTRLARTGVPGKESPCAGHGARRRRLARPARGSTK